MGMKNGVAGRGPSRAQEPALPIHCARCIQFRQVELGWQFPASQAVNLRTGAEGIRIGPCVGQCHRHPSMAILRDETAGGSWSDAHAVLIGRRCDADKRCDTLTVLINQGQSALARFHGQQRAGAGRIVAAVGRLGRRDRAGARNENGQHFSVYRRHLGIAAGEYERCRALRTRGIKRDWRIAFGRRNGRKIAKWNATATAAASGQDESTNYHYQILQFLNFHDYDVRNARGK